MITIICFSLAISDLLDDGDDDNLGLGIGGADIKLSGEGHKTWCMYAS